MRKKPIIAQPMTPRQVREAAEAEKAQRREHIARSEERFAREADIARQKYGENHDNRQAGEVNDRQYTARQNAIRRNEVKAAKTAETDITAQERMMRKADARVSDAQRGINRTKVKDVPADPSPKPKPKK